MGHSFDNYKINIYIKYKNGIKSSDGAQTIDNSAAEGRSRDCQHELHVAVEQICPITSHIVKFEKERGAWWSSAYTA